MFDFFERFSIDGKEVLAYLLYKVRSFSLSIIAAGYFRAPQLCNTKVNAGNVVFAYLLGKVRFISLSIIAAFVISSIASPRISTTELGGS